MPTLTIPASVPKRKAACSSCRQRKKKCDAQRPACALCKKWGISCTYNIPANDRNYSQADDTRAWQAPQLFHSPTSSGLELEQPSSLDFMQMTGMNFDAFGPEIQYPTPESDPPHESDPLADFHLPSHDLVVELVNLFFDHLYHLFPCFHRKSFQEQVQNGTMAKDSPLILYTICCVSARLHPDLSVKRRQVDWYEQAKFSYQLTQRAPDPGLRILQAALLLVFHAGTVGDFSSGWLFLGKAWRQACALGMNHMDVKKTSMGRKPHDDQNIFGLPNCAGATTIEKEEQRRTLWLLFMADRMQAWPTGWPNALPETHFKVDIPVADTLLQAMTSEGQHRTFDNTPFTGNLGRLIGSLPSAEDPINIFHYICVAHILLGRVSELIHSLHEAPDTPEYAQKCEELDAHVVKFRLSLPRQATSILEASAADRGHVVWLQIILNIAAMLLNFRCVTDVPVTNASSQFLLAVIAARNTAQVVKDASRISIDLLMSAHIASSLYVAACVLVIQWRITGDATLKDDVDVLELTFDRMNDTFVYLGMKFKFALEHDLKRSREELIEKRDRGIQGLLVDCSKWKHVKEAVLRSGISIDIT